MEKLKPGIDTPDDTKDYMVVTQPLAQALWEAPFLENFKILSLPTFKGKTDSLEHLLAVETQPGAVPPITEGVQVNPLDTKTLHHISTLFSL
ncbi:hypothetical protein QL285_029019 [Trifolium repens]|nr:hypothetical protein QL285_029019 [Trifolium repens]